MASNHNEHCTCFECFSEDDPFRSTPVFQLQYYKNKEGVRMEDRLPPPPPVKPELESLLQAARAAQPTTEVRVTDPVTGGQKGSKPERYDLVPMDAMDEVARVYGFGSAKYDDHNWSKGYKWSLSLAALLRHVSCVMQGEDRDPESGKLHMAHVAWHALTMVAFQIRNVGTDDRKKTK